MKLKPGILLKPLCFLAILLSSCLQAQESGQAIVDSLRPVLDTQTVSILHVELKRFDLGQLARRLNAAHAGASETGPFESQKLIEFASSYQSVLSDTRELGALDVNFVFKIGTLVPENMLVVLRCVDEEAAGKVAERLDSFRRGGRADTLSSLVILGPDRWVRHAKVPEPWYLFHTEESLSVLATALDLGRAAPLRFAFALTPDQRRALVEIAPATYAGGELGSPASIEHLQWIAASFDLEADMLNLQLETSSPESANAISSRLVESAAAIVNLAQFKERYPTLARWIASTKLDTQGTSIVVNLKAESLSMLYAAVSAPVLRVFRSQRTQRSISQLRQITIAMHNYHDAYNRLPAIASRDENGKPLLSWRVHLLPYSDAGMELYKQFKLDEPWDSPHNKQLIPRIPSIYAMDGSNIDSGLTRILAPIGTGTAISESGVGLRKIPDGTSRTIAVLEANAESAVVWTRPEEFEVEGDDLLSKLVQPGDDGFWVGLCDASLQYIPNDVGETTLRSAFLIDDGGPDKIPGVSIPLPEFYSSPGIAPDEAYNPLEELPEFWLNDLIPAFRIISGLSGG